MFAPRVGYAGARLINKQINEQANKQTQTTKTTNLKIVNHVKRRKIFEFKHQPAVVTHSKKKC